MQRNLEKYAHCGKALVGLTEKIPTVNRTAGKTFHVALYSGPDVNSSRFVCIFVYVHDRLGPDNHYVTVAICCPSKNLRETLQQAQDAADEIATLVQVGAELGPSYFLNRGLMRPSRYW